MKSECISIGLVLSIFIFLASVYLFSVFRTSGTVSVGLFLIIFVGLSLFLSGVIFSRSEQIFSFNLSLIGAIIVLYLGISIAGTYAFNAFSTLFLLVSLILFQFGLPKFEVK